jgi:REP element-mobilizing transposase RayT
MPQSLSNILIHIVFSTRSRVPVLEEQLQPRLHAYLAELVRNQNCECYRVGGVQDHVHLAIRLSRTLQVCHLIEKLKTESSKWLKAQSEELTSFAWQRGYAALSVDPDGLSGLRHYIDTQPDHHKKFNFQDEYRALLREYGIEFDERYMWD